MLLLGRGGRSGPKSLRLEMLATESVKVFYNTKSEEEEKMSKRKKKKRNRGPAPLSPKEYVVTKARNLPIYESLISPNWEEAGVADILIARKHKNDHITLRPLSRGFIMRGS